MNSQGEKIFELIELTKDFPLSKSIWGKEKKMLRAVNNASLSLCKGKTVGIVGESGSGKTTIARLMLRLITPTKGFVLYKGKDVFQLKGEDLLSFRKDVQVVLQNPFSSLNPRMKVREIIGEPLLTHGLLKRKDLRERIEGLLRLCGLKEHDMDKYPHQFSGGQRQRIAVARAISTNASIVILDEPTASLDVSIRAQILNLFKDIQEKLAMTYVFISHDLALVYCMCDSAIVMYQGKIVEAGPCSELFLHPAHPYSQVLLNSTLAPDPNYRFSTVVNGDIADTKPSEKGCLFRERCKHSLDICATETPTIKYIDSEHYLVCHLGTSLMV